MNQVDPSVSLEMDQDITEASEITLYSSLEEIRFTDTVQERMIEDGSIHKYTNSQGETMEFDISNYFYVYDGLLSLDELMEIQQNGIANIETGKRPSIMCYGTSGDKTGVVTLYYSKDTNMIGSIFFSDKSRFSLPLTIRPNMLDGPDDLIIDDTFETKVFEYVFGSANSRYGIVLFNNDEEYILFFDDFTISLKDHRGLTRNELKLFDGRLEYVVEKNRLYNLREECIPLAIKFNLLKSLIYNKVHKINDDNPYGITFATETADLES